MRCVSQNKSISQTAAGSVATDPAVLHALLAALAALLLLVAILAAACVALLRRRKREQRLLRTSPTGVAAAETVVQAVEVEVQEAGVGTAVAQVWAASRVAVPAEVLVQPGRVQV